MNRKTLARVGSVIALFALLALPLASCGEVRLTGTDILLRIEEAPGLKMLILVCIVAAIAAIFVVSRWAHLLAGGTGLAAFLYAAIALNVNRGDATEMRLGSLIGGFGFLLIFISGLLQDPKKKPG